MKRRARTAVSREDEGEALLEVLAQRFTYHTRSGWRDLIDAGRVLLNDTPARAETRLSAEDIIEYLIPDVAEPPVDKRFTVVYEDSDILVIDKPGNLPCHPAGKYFENTLWALLHAEFAAEKLQFVNRLDRETSGLVLLARNAESARACRVQFEQRTVGKDYLALVEGSFPGTVRCTGELVAAPDSPVRKKQQVVPSTDGGAESQRVVTAFRCLSVAGGISLVEAKPETGRLHQIRASLCSRGFPVVGDKLYGVDETAFLRFIADGLTTEDRRRLGMSRQALHASELRLSHPRSERRLVFASPLPEDMGRVLEDQR